jgi:peptide-methionine (S)-S-oxide reductase
MKQMTFQIERKLLMYKLAFIYLIGFLALGLLGTTYASGAEGRSSVSENKLEKATFAGGCFWCMQPPFDKLDGVVSTTVGYCGGKEENPTYKQVSAGRTGHAEAVEILYDPSRVSYTELLNVFWMNIDPTQENGQFADIGAQYRTAIFYHSEEQKRLAETSKQELKNTGRFSKEIVTEIVPATPFYRAEEYHQDYYKKNPLRYKIYRYGSGRDDYLVRKWGKK